jgi:hypothetical protein
VRVLAEGQFLRVVQVLQDVAVRGGNPQRQEPDDAAAHGLLLLRGGLEDPQRHGLPFVHQPGIAGHGMALDGDAGLPLNGPEGPLRQAGLLGEALFG